MNNSQYKTTLVNQYNRLINDGYHISKSNSINNKQIYILKKGEYEILFYFSEETNFITDDENDIENIWNKFNNFVKLK